jgi:7,8-dihydropterin-6-yl-methyl-4-(beta-D-ribofuranosyl)aminobenzene 5'-phosphate synthase
MRLTVLMDNQTLTDRYFVAEPAVSYFIEEDGAKVLFDTGYSNAFIANARKLRIDLLDLDFVVLSHGHLDHSWGLVPLIRLFAEGRLEGLRVSKPALVAHPAALAPRRLESHPQAGSLLSEEQLSRFFHLRLSREPVSLTERLWFLGEIERRTDFEATSPLGFVGEAGEERDDFLVDDSALAYRSSQGLVVVTGCSHSGICNIVKQAKKVLGDDQVLDIVGGLHLLDPAPEQLSGTAAYLKALRPAALHACHCTDLPSKIALSSVVELKEVGVGLTLEW